MHKIFLFFYATCGVISTTNGRFANNSPYTRSLGFRRRNPGFPQVIRILLLPAALLSPYLLFAIRGGMPRFLPGYLLQMFALLAAATALLHHPRMRAAVERHHRLLLTGGCTAYFLAAFLMGKLWDPFALGAEVYNFHQELLGTLNGEFFPHPTEHRSEFAIHFSPVLFPVLAIFALLPVPATLFAIGSAAITLGILAAYRFLLRRWAPHEAALLAFGAALFPSILSLHIDFTPVRFAPAAIWFAMTAYRDKNPKMLALAFVFCFCIKETLALALIMFAPVALLDRRNFRWILVPSAAALAGFLVVNQFIIPSFAGTLGKSTSTIASQFGYWGNTAPQVIIGFIKDPLSVAAALFKLNNAAYLIKLGHPALFIFPLASPMILLAVPEAMVNMLAGYGRIAHEFGPWTSLVGHYSATVGTAIWAAATDGALPRINEMDSTEAVAERRWRRARLLFLAVLSGAIYPTNGETL